MEFLNVLEGLGNPAWVRSRPEPTDAATPLRGADKAPLFVGSRKYVAILHALSQTSLPPFYPSTHAVPVPGLGGGGAYRPKGTPGGLLWPAVEILGTKRSTRETKRRLAVPLLSTDPL